MNIYLEIFEVFGLFVFLLVFLISLYKLLARLNLAKENRSLLIGIISLIVFSALHLSRQWWIPWVVHSEFSQTAILKGIQVFWWISLGITITQAVDFFLWKGIFQEEGELIVPKLLTDIISLLLYMFIAGAILHYVFEKPIIGLAATSGLIALIVGYSAQNTLADVFAGLALNLSKSFKKGDWINIEGMVGKVTDMNWRYVSLETIYENHLSIPNSTVAEAKITNYYRPKKYRGDTFRILIEHGLSPEKARELILASARDSKFILKEPSPEVAISEYGDNGIYYELWYYTEEPDDYYIRNDVFRGLWYRVKNEGVQISLSDIAMHKPVEGPKKDISSVMNLLKHADIFSLLTEDELQLLALRVKRIEYGAPERVVVQGSSGSSMYIVESGKLAVLLEEKDGTHLNIAKLGPGSIFGEMSLLTGAPRTATVQAITDVVAYEITKDDLHSIFEKRKDIIDKIGILNEKRLLEIQHKEEDYLAQEKVEKEVQTIGRKFAQRIRDFFSL